MQTGTVKFFKEDKGYGFITGDDGQDVFVHVSQVSTGDKLTKGSKVEYSTEQGKRGPQAVDVMVVQ